MPVFRRIYRRCQYCWKMMLQKDVTVFPKNSEARNEWVEILGEGFAEQMKKRSGKRSFICRAHVSQESVSGISSHTTSSVPFPSEVPTSSTSSAGNILTDDDEFVLDFGDMDVDLVELSDAMDSGDDEEEDTDEDVESEEENSGEDEKEDSGEDEKEDSGEDEKEDSGEDEEALSVYEPSSDSVGESGGEIEGDDSDDFEYVLVELEQILEILKYCRACRSECVGVSMGKPSGYAVTIKLECSMCFNTWQWSSSRNLEQNRGYCVNRDVASAAVCTGNSFSKLSSFFHTIRSPYMHSSAHYATVKNCVRPVVEQLYTETQKEIRDIVVQNATLHQKDLDLAGDAQYDHPGHTAEHARYAILDVDTNFVLEAQLLRKSSKSGNFCFLAVNNEYLVLSESSKSLEPKSLDLALTNLQESLKLPDGTERIGIRSITTDRDPSVAKLLATKYKRICIFFDGWHFARNVKKSIWNKLDQKQMRPVKPWIKQLNNHLYYSFSSSAGDGKLAVEKFMGFFLHIQGIHDNFTQVNGFKFHRINKCDHGVLSTKRSDYIDLKNRAHLKAFELLWKMVATEKRLRDLEKVSPFHNTSEVESFNSLGTIYHSKSAFFHANFPMRVQLTVLHWNNLKLDWYSGARTIKGLKKSFNKSTKEDVWKYRKSPATQKWRRTILNRVRTH